MRRQVGKIFYLMGKSASGKDTLYEGIREACPGLSGITLYTTRPIREGEKDGEEYFFVPKDRLDAYRRAGKLIEQRTYHTVCGDWHYATVDDGRMDLEKGNYLGIGTLESFEKMKKYFGKDRIVPIYIEVEDGERLLRAVRREQAQINPSYSEVCRRFLADEKDFSEENLKKAGISRRFYNRDKQECLREIRREIQE